MHDHNLDDLIIDNIEPKNSKTKSFLTIIALLIVVLIVAIILTKILLKTPDENGLAFKEDTTELIAPELQLKETPKPQKVKEEPSLSNMIESKPKAPVVATKRTESIEKSTVVIQKEEPKLPDVSKAVETKKEPVLSNILDQEIKAPVAETTKAVIVQEPSSVTLKEKEAKDAADIAYWKAVQKKRKAAEKKREETVQVTAPVKPKKVQTPKHVVQHVKKPVRKPLTTKSVPKTVPSKKYYVQVGAYRKKPSTRFISVIRNNRYQYIITKPDRNGIKRLLIGPYSDRASVNRALIDVKDRIHKRAFIVKR
jgi:DedD protein